MISIKREIEPEMVYVPAGDFWMGSDEHDPDSYDEEKPKHQLYLPEFWIGRYPVTVLQFAAFVKDVRYRTTREKESHYTWQHPLGRGSDLRGKDNHPVTWVSWYDAMAYCQWLTERTGRRYTLLSEAEWEKAARGVDGRIYPWGNEWDPDRCNSLDSNKNDTTSVGLYSPRGDSPYGCADMAGNVWEWTRSLWGKNFGYPDFCYPYDPLDGREDIGAPKQSHRVVRGGLFNLGRWGVRCAFRYGRIPTNGQRGVGFRVMASQ